MIAFAFLANWSSWRAISKVGSQVCTVSALRIMWVLLAIKLRFYQCIEDFDSRFGLGTCYCNNLR